MSRGSGAALLGALFLAGAAAGLLAAGGEAGSAASHATSRSEATTRVAVTATDSSSGVKRSAPTGPVIFTVTNKGKVSARLQDRREENAAALARHSAMLRVRFSKKGQYPYRSTCPGQASPASRAPSSWSQRPLRRSLGPRPRPDHHGHGWFSQHDGYGRHGRL